MLFLPRLVDAQQFCQPENILASTPSSRFNVAGNGTIVDSATDLMWQRCLVGVSGANCDNAKPLELTWAEALQYPAKLNDADGFAGFKDWRLPNIRELSTLAEVQCVAPAINLEIFPATPPSHVWTSSPYHFYTHYSWYVDFNNGAATYDERIRAKMLRLVRDID